MEHVASLLDQPGAVNHFSSRIKAWLGGTFTYGAKGKGGGSG